MADINRINDLVGEKDFQTAKVLIEEALKEEPDNLELIKLSGLTYMNLNEWKDARSAFETVVKYNPEDASSWFYLGGCYDKLGDFISAKNAYNTVIELRQGYIEAYKSLCVVLMKLNEPEEAIKKADLILLVLDVSKPLDEIDYRLLELTKTKKRIIVANKNDLKAVNEINDAIYISALNHNGLDELIDAIYKVTNFNEFNLDDGRYLNNSRQVDLMQKAYDSLVSAKNAIENQVDIALIEIDIKECFDNLGRITGQAYSDELITALFSKFCLGK